MSERKSRILTEAERQVARYNLLTTTQVADRLSEKNIDGDTVRAWCRAGWLKSVDGRKPGSTQPYYLIDWDWVEQFISEGGAAAHHHDAA